MEELMAERFMMFIDGANLQSVLSAADLRSDSYDVLIKYLFQASVSQWKSSFDRTEELNISARFVRAYFYGAGTMDDWDLDDPVSVAALRGMFDRQTKVASAWASIASQQSGKKTGKAVEELAWDLFLGETRRWYESKKVSHEGTKRFLYAIEMKSPFVEVNKEGHIKLNLLSHTAHEKGVDTGFSVAMVAMAESYDVAILASGDFDGIPAIRHIKGKGKQVGLIDIYQETSTDRRGPNLSKELEREADFVTSVSDRELLEADVVIAKPRANFR
jgi:uncharacterized LabA/DUF88 family protein